MLSFSDMIRRWPSRTAFAADIGLSIQSATNMVKRNSVSSKYWAQMVLGAQERGIEGVTFAALMAAANARRHNKEAA